MAADHSFSYHVLKCVMKAQLVLEKHPKLKSNFFEHAAMDTFPEKVGKKTHSNMKKNVLSNLLNSRIHISDDSMCC